MNYKIVKPVKILDKEIPSATSAKIKILPLLMVVEF